MREATDHLGAYVHAHASMLTSIVGQVHAEMTEQCIILAHVCCAMYVSGISSIAAMARCNKVFVSQCGDSLCVRTHYCFTIIICESQISPQIQFEK